ncbi:hypothetical protein JKF63_04042 [Porcisia hertigi]|uniref:Mini-chromosome maintenance complex-binding protein n=1 Tax=Porcisia hertigi TaxID=2761500 RepID=A0A836LHC9_9TRYP|nr:hypothetical protein JKF63_04042 [Porcisia hertigi]
MATQPEMEVLLRERSATTGSLSEALRYAHKYLQSEECQKTAIDVFPPTQLAQSIFRLCRCRGMIQEVQPELHLFRASPQNFFSCGSSQEAANLDDVQYIEAALLYVIPVPGNLHFYDVDELSRSSDTAQCGTLRKRSDRGEAASSAHPLSNSDDDPIRKHTRHKADMSDPTCAVTQSSSTRSLGPSLNLPHPSCSRHLQSACVVTVLLPTDDGPRDSRFRINDVVDLYGYQHFPDDQLPANETDDFERFSAWNATELSKGLVSRLLCLSYTPVSSLHLRLNLTRPALISSSMTEARSDAIAYLTGTLTNGDALVAEYLLLHLCARVSMHSASTPVGDLPLLISSPHVVAAEWSAQLREIVPVAEILLTDDVLRSHANGRLIPKYNNELNYLETGVLQVANGTHITIDCGSLGSRDETWYEGMFALVHKQQLLLEYAYQTLELPVDVSILALNSADTPDAVHPLFRFATSLPWRADANLAKEVSTTHNISSGVVRAYLDAVRCLDVSLQGVDALSERASRALVEMAENLPGWNNRDPLLHNNSFSAAMALMRAHAASHGRASFTTDDILAVYQLERARMERIGVPLATQLSTSSPDAE